MAIVESVKDAWKQLAGLDCLEDGLVLVDATSPFAPRDWIGILAIADMVVASVPRVELRDPVARAIGGLGMSDATDPDVVLDRLPPMQDVLGPAALFYADHGLHLAEPTGVEEVTRSEIEGLLREVSPEDLHESGLAEITSPVFGTRATEGRLVAVSGYRRWSNHVAHLSVLTHVDHRGVGHGRAVAAAALGRARQEALLPQWRARPLASQALARRLGLIEVGAQLCLRPV